MLSARMPVGDVQVTKGDNVLFSLCRAVKYTLLRDGSKEVPIALHILMNTPADASSTTNNWVLLRFTDLT